MATATTTPKSTTAKENTMSRSTASTDYDDLNRQIEALKGDVSRLTGTIADLGKAEASRLKAGAKEKAEDLKAMGELRYEQLQNTADAYLRDGERFVRTQPGTALGIAAGVGFFIGFLMSRR